MTETISAKQPSRSIDLARVFATLTRPRAAFESAREESRSTWLTPMLVLSLTSLVVILVSGYLKAQAAMLGEVQLPLGWEWWSPAMRDNFMQAQALRQGTVFTYVIPLVGLLARLWLGWVALAGLMHLGSTVLGGRGSMQSAMNIVAWSLLPFALRDVLRIVFMLVEGHAIGSPGLSGFATGVFLTQVLARVDIFLLWCVVLMIIGLAVTDGLTGVKASIDVIVVLVILLSAQAGIGSALAGVGVV